jgi:hypothetical protein
LDFLKDCPPEYEQIMRKIDALSFVDAPDYQAFIGILESVSFENLNTKYFLEIFPDNP